MKRVDLSVAPFALQVSSSKIDGGDEAAVQKNQSEPPAPVTDPCRNGCTVRYRECMKNHAASIGGHANDGCGEFMLAGGEGDVDQAGSTLKCAACGCHRNFHRKEVGTGDHHYLVHHPSPASVVVSPTPARGGGWEQKRVFESFPYLSALPMPQLITSTTAAHVYGTGTGVSGGVDQLRGQNECAREDRRSETPDGLEDQNNMVRLTKYTKRFRTKFTQEQKERMMEFAEKLGWRIQRHDDVALNQFCSEIGVKRRVLKVWMHNNKSVLMRKRSDDAAAPLVLLPPPPADEDDDDDDDDDAAAAAAAREDGPAAAESTIGE